MASFNDQLARMQGLMNYGVVTESEIKPSKSIEYQEIGADGKSYAIIKENAHYVIKKAPADQGTILEAYEYLDGWNHLDKHEYHSYNEAKKQFGFKMSSLNEAYNYNIDKDDVSSYANMQLMTEGSEKMMNEIARQKQIMFNAAAILKEESAISRSNVGNPEAPKQGYGKAADCGEPFGEKAEAKLDKDPKQASGKPESMGDPYGDGEKAKEMKDAEFVPAGSVAAAKPKGGKVVRVNEGAMDNVAEKAAEDSLKINEDEDTFSAGLPGEAGIGNPSETKKHIMEDDEDDIVIDGEDEEGEDIDLGEDEIDPEDGEEITLSDEGDEVEDGEEIELSDDGEEEEESIDDLKAQIEELEARISELEAGEEGEEESLEDDDLDDEDIDDEEEIEGEPELTDDLDSEDGIESDEMDDDTIDLTQDEDADQFIESVIKSVSGGILAEQAKSHYMNNIVNDVVNSILSEGVGFDAAKEAFQAGYEGDTIDNDEFKQIVKGKEDPAYKTDYLSTLAGSYPKGSEERADAELDKLLGSRKFSDRAKRFGIAAANKVGGGLRKFKNAVNAPIGESKEIKEERTELHDFGKHPGYRKKPMTLPETGSDEFNGRRDWNDESVHNEKPFGQGKGKSDPYGKEALIQAVTEDVMKQLKKKA